MVDLAQKLAIDPSHLCKLLQGAPFTSSTLTRFTRVLECEPGSLLKGK